MIREFLEAELTDRGEADLAELVEKAKKRFRDDAEFNSVLFEDAVSVLVATELRGLANSRRASLLSSGRLLTEEALGNHVREWMARTLEPVADGHRKALLNLNRPEGLRVLAVYDEKIGGLTRYRGLVADLVDGLRDDIETFGQRYTDVELNSIFNKHLR